MRTVFRALLTWAGVGLCWGMTLAAPGQTAPDKNAAKPISSEQSVPVQISSEQISRQATTLLRAKCVSCHNANVKSGGVDLSSRANAVTTNAFAPGKSEISRLVRQVQTGKMPPTGKLSPADVSLLTHWIASGAPWSATANGTSLQKEALYWSLQPVRSPSVPHTPYDALAITPIDNFIFARLAAKRLRPSAPADRLTLLKRVSIDLTGLPPTTHEIDAFLKDKTPSAYEKVVDRLLASTAYGERWGRHWLDVVRYGESSGYEQNHVRPNAWPYRDYVIRAFNSDKPYPRFIEEQLAGDVVASQSQQPEDSSATGFLVAGIHDTVGIQTDEGTRQQRANDLDDIVATTSGAFMGLSVGCARCHDHKFDPIPQKDYYRLTACFAGVRHGERPLPTLADSSQTAEQTKLKTQSLRDTVFNAANALNVIEDAARQRVLQQHGLKNGLPASIRPPVNARRNVDDFPPTIARFVRFTVLATGDGTEPCLDELQVFGASATRNLALATEGAKATASSLLPGYAAHQIAHLNDGLLGNEWSWISNTRGSGWAQIELPKAMSVQRVVWSRDAAAIPRFDDRLPTKYRIEVSQDGMLWETVSTEAGRTGSSDYIHPDELVKRMTVEERSSRDALLDKRADAEREIARLNSKQVAYIGQFGAPDPIFLLNRGDVMQRTEQVTPGGLSCISGLSTGLNLPDNAAEPQRRLALAHWIGDSRNPLTPRVMVNRVWQYHFGRGLVSTPSDFGRNGDKPTHPELLDWLAGRFMASTSDNSYACGWHLKPLHKMMVMSYVYRQSADATPRAMAVDAGNQSLWRMPLRRLEAEAIRDSILQASGKLDRHMGGPSYQLFKYGVVNVAIYGPQENYGPETWRRSVYQTPARGIHDELLSAFDCPESSQRAPHRDATTTALQALNLLNGPFLQQQAGFCTERVRLQAGNSSTAQVQSAFRLTFGRNPTAAEQKAALSLVTSQGLPALCRALMNANEFLYY